MLAGEGIAFEAQGCLSRSFRSVTEFRIGCMTEVPVFLLAVVYRSVVFLLFPRPARKNDRFLRVGAGD